MRVTTEHEPESPAGRLMALLSLLQSRPSWTAEQLGERLGVTTRTVRRTVTRLRDLGYPVDADSGPYGGYRLGAGAALPPLLLGDDEAVAIIVGLRLATGHGVTGFEDAAVAALVKLEQVMPGRLRERAAALQATAFPVPRRPVPEVAPETLVTVAQACRRLERLRFTYVDRNDEASERRVEPFQVVHADRRWYLVARDMTRAAWRTFRLDRMSSVSLTGHRFVRGDEPDAQAMVEEGLAYAPYQWQAVIDLPVPLEEVAEEIPRTVGILAATDGGTRLRFGANDLGWLARYLVSLPFPFRVVEPSELRAVLAELGARIHAEHA